MRRSVAIGLALLGVLVLAWAFWPAKQLSDEEQIRAAIDDMADAASHKQLGKLMEHVSEHYQGEAGGKADLKSLLASFLFRSDFVSAWVTHLDVQVDGNDAQVKMGVVLSRVPIKSVEELKPEVIAGAHRIEAKFAREDAWRVVTATRSDASATDLLAP
jgi:hypothetical protein